MPSSQGVCDKWLGRHIVEFVRENIGESQARQVDWEHCRQIFE